MQEEESEDTQAKMEEKPKMSHTRPPSPPARSLAQRRSGTPLQEPAFHMSFEGKKKTALTAKRLAAACGTGGAVRARVNVAWKRRKSGSEALGALFLFFWQPGRTEGAVRARECGADLSR